MASQGKSQILQEMQKAPKMCWDFRPRAFTLVFKPLPLNPMRELAEEDADCDVDNDNVHFDRLQKPITLSNH